MTDKQSVADLIKEATVAFDEERRGENIIDGVDYGRADGLWHFVAGTNEQMCGVEIALRVNADVESLIAAEAEAAGFGLRMFGSCAKCNEQTALLPIYGVSGGFSGRHIFYLTAPAPQATKASE